jgi:hypothetical protein
MKGRMMYYKEKKNMDLSEQNEDMEKEKDDDKHYRWTGGIHHDNNIFVFHRYFDGADFGIHADFSIGLDSRSTYVSSSSSSRRRRRRSNKSRSMGDVPNGGDSGGRRHLLNIIDEILRKNQQQPPEIDEKNHKFIQRYDKTNQ